MLEIFYCEICMGNLAENEHFFEIYDALCEDFIINDFMPLFIEESLYIKNIEQFLNILNSLEKNGYVLSLECGPSLLQVKPLGYQLDQENHIFCVCDNEDEGQDEQYYN